MEPNFKVRSKFNKKDYKKYLRLATFKGKKTTLPALIIIPFLLSVIIPFGLNSITKDGTNIFSIKGVFFLYIPFLLISFAIVFLKLFITNIKMSLVDTSNVFDTYNTFSFYQDEVVVENDSIDGQNPIKYSTFHKVLESDDYFIIYFSDFIVSIIRKKDIGDIDQELADFLKRKIGKKYKRI